MGYFVPNSYLFGALERYYPPGFGLVPDSPDEIGYLLFPLTFVSSLEQPYCGGLLITMVQTYLPFVLMAPCSTCTALGWQWERLSVPLHRLMTNRYRGDSAFKLALDRRDLVLLLLHTRYGFPYLYTFKLHGPHPHNCPVVKVQGWFGLSLSSPPSLSFGAGS